MKGAVEITFRRVLQSCIRAEFKLAVVAILELFQLDLSTTITPGSTGTSSLDELFLAIFSSGSPFAAALGRL